MRHIPTSTETVDKLKKQAKRLQRNGGGKHADLLDRVAHGAGYMHWHHVTVCHKTTTSKRGVHALREEIALIAKAVDEKVVKFIVTGPEVMPANPLLLFSSSDGDAWLLDPEASLTACLIWHEQRRSVTIEEDEKRIFIDWDGPFSIDGEDFIVDAQPSKDENAARIGSRRIMGYPVAELTERLELLRSKNKAIAENFTAIFERPDAVELTDELIEELAASGSWDAAQLRQLAAQGHVYSPSRQSILSPLHFGGDWSRSDRVNSRRPEPKDVPAMNPPGAAQSDPQRPREGT
jgi:hypothetical protein